jgi:hypothetical protein
MTARTSPGFGPKRSQWSRAGTETSFHGPFQIAGVVDRINSPGPYLVRLHYKQSGAVVAQTVADADGNYLFQNLSDMGHDLAVANDCPYYAVAFDHSAEPVSAAVSDQLTLELMP